MCSFRCPATNLDFPKAQRATNESALTLAKPMPCHLWRLHRFYGIDEPKPI
jgi:hypothetical protein